MEPCVMGLPVIFGPLYDNSPEAVDLLKKNLAFSIKRKEEFHEILFHLLQHREYCDELGKEAAHTIESKAVRQQNASNSSKRSAMKFSFLTFFKKFYKVQKQIKIIPY